MPPAMVIGLCLDSFNIWCCTKILFEQGKKVGRGCIKAWIPFASFNVGGLPGSQPAVVWVGGGTR